MAKRTPLFLLSALMLCALAAAQDAPVSLPPVPDSMRIEGIAISAYQLADSAQTRHLAPGDSVYLFDGALYFRARVGESDFFVARDEIIRHSDSLVVYQSLRLTPAAQTAGLSDTATAKVKRQRCNAITKDGTRCSRMALPGLDKCWQHKK